LQLLLSTHLLLRIQDSIEVYILSSDGQAILAQYHFITREQVSGAGNPFNII
jgi:hypothetical protein